MSLPIRFLLLLSLLPLISSCGMVQPDGVFGDVMKGKIFDGSAKPYCCKEDEDVQRDLKTLHGLHRQHRAHGDDALS